MALGRGLSSLIPSWKPPMGQNFPGAEADISLLKKEGVLLFLNPEIIDPNPFQPREDFHHSNLEELVNSIKVHGIIEPLIVSEKSDGRYELISGERRLRAAKFLGLDKVPALLRRAQDWEKLEIALVENLQRQDLNSIEEAEGYRQLIENFNLIQEEVAKKVGKSREAVANTLRLLALPKEMKVALAAGKISPTHGRLLLQIKDEKERQRVFQDILAERLSVKEAEIRGQATIKRRSVSAFKDPKVLAAEARLREKFGTKVKVEKTGDKGKVVLEFYSEEEFNDLLEKLEA